MVIDFNKIETVVHPRFKDGDGDTLFRTFNDGLNKIMYGRLDVGCSIGYHPHDCNSEIIFIISGTARCRYDDGEERLTAGQCHYCPKGHSHCLINDSSDSPLLFYAVVAEQATNGHGQ